MKDICTPSTPEQHFFVGEYPTRDEVVNALIVFGLEDHAETEIRFLDWYKEGAPEPGPLADVITRTPAAELTQYGPDVLRHRITDLLFKTGTVYKMYIDQD